MSEFLAMLGDDYQKECICGERGRPDFRHTDRCPVSPLFEPSVVAKKDGLDERVLLAIRGGSTTSPMIRNHIPSYVSPRTLDSSLQRLRRNGVIRFERGHWHEEQRA